MRTPHLYHETLSECGSARFTATTSASTITFTEEDAPPQLQVAIATLQDDRYPYTHITVGDTTVTIA